MSLHRLARTHGLGSRSGWQWWTPYGPIYDDRLVEITVTRGGPVEGLVPATAEVRVAGPLPPIPQASQATNLTMTTPMLQWVGDRAGMNVERLRYRFVGRVAEQSVTDTSRGQLESRATCTDWAALVASINPPAAAYRADPTLGHLYADLWDSSGVPTPAPTLLGEHRHRVVIGPDDPNPLPISTSDVWGLYAANIGTMIRTTRAGLPEAHALIYRRDAASTWQSTAPVPLQRTQVLSPVEWAMPAAVPTRVALRWRGPTGQPQTTTLSVGDGSFTAATDERDTTMIQPVDGGTAVVAAANAMVWRSAPGGYSVRSLTCDVLALLGSTARADRQQAVQLLALEAGDPIALGTDWPEHVGGMHYVTQITERVTPDSWTVELEIIPHYQVTGMPADPVRSYSWDTALPTTATWDDVRAPWDHL